MYPFFVCIISNMPHELCEPVFVDLPFWLLGTSPLPLRIPARFRVTRGFYLDASLRRQESSTMKMEAKTKEAEANMTAAQKLLNAAWTSGDQGDWGSGR